MTAERTSLSGLYPGPIASITSTTRPATQRYRLNDCIREATDRLHPRA